MSVIAHELTEEFPEYADKINELNETNAQFAKIFGDYHVVNREIYLAESEIQPTDDFHLEDLRKHRLLLKDQLFAMLLD